MHHSIQDFVSSQALLVRLAKEDNADRDCFYRHPEVVPVSPEYPSVTIVNTRPAVSHRSLPYPEGIGFFSGDRWKDLPCISKVRIFPSEYPTYSGEELSVQLMLKTAHFSDNVDRMKMSAWIIGAHFYGASAGPDYDNAFARLIEFESEDPDWDGMNGQPADSQTAQAVRQLLLLSRALYISRPSLTLSNNGAVSVIWKDSTRFATLKFKGNDQYSAIVLVDRKPYLTMNSTVGQLPQALEQFLIESFKEDVTTHLSELPKRLR